MSIWVNASNVVSNRIQRQYNSTTKKVEFVINTEFYIKVVKPTTTTCSTLAANVRNIMYFGFKLGTFDSCGGTNIFPYMHSLSNWGYTVNGEYGISPNVYSIDAKYYNSNLRNVGSQLVFRGMEYDVTTPGTCSRWRIGRESTAAGSSFGYCGLQSNSSPWMGAIAVDVYGVEPPLPAAIPTISASTACIDDQISVIITLVNPNTDNVDYFSVRKSDTLNGTYVEIGQISTGDTEYIDSSSGGYYKVYAINDLYDDVCSEVVYQTYVPIIEGSMIYEDFPIPNYSAQTTNMCADVDAVYWYLDDDYIGSGTTNTWSGTLPEIDRDYVLTAKYEYDGTLSDESNQVILELIHIYINISGLTASGTTCSSSTLTWEMETNVDVLGIYLQEFIDDAWTSIDEVSSGTTSYNLTGLTPNTNYIYRLVGYSEIYSRPSTSISITTINASPQNLGVFVDRLKANLSWNFLCDYGTEIQIRSYNSSYTSYTLIDTIDADDTEYQLTDLDWNTTYYIGVVRIGSEYPAFIEFSTPELVFLPDFCTALPYAVDGGTCGNDDGSIVITDEYYFDFYNIVLVDSFGNTYSNSGDTFNNLPLGYYTLTATPKPEYWYHYGRDACVIEWIKVEPVDTTINVSAVSVKPEMNDESGRIVITITDSHSTYNVWFYDVFGNQIKFISGTTEKQFVYEGFGCIYVIIKNTDNGCGLLLGAYCIPKQNTRAIGGLKRVFIAPYESILDVNYWKSDDEDFFVSTLDPSFFYSTKIKSIETALTWYSLPIHNRQPSFEQRMQKSRQGIGFIDVLKVNVARQVVDKLNDLMLLFGSKFCIVVQDANSQWWVSGYKIPAELKNVKLITNTRGASNEYQLEFESISTDNIITSIDTQWVKDNIL